MEESSREKVSKSIVFPKDPEKVKKIEDRFWKKVFIPYGDRSQCWFWLGYIAKNGYGRFSFRTGDSYAAHRVAYELTVNVVPSDMSIDHLCRVRDCVNPDHLEVVDFRTNVLRGNNNAAQNARKTHCPRGHELSGNNLVPYLLNKYGRRSCKICKYDYEKARKRRIRGQGK